MRWFVLTLLLLLLSPWWSVFSNNF